MQVVLEVFLVKFWQEKVVYISEHHQFSQSATNPDRLAREVASGYLPSSALLQKACLIHSTSWRYEPAGQLVLTYLIFSQELAFANKAISFLSLSQLELVTSSDPTIPRPTVIKEVNVLAHALRHLAFLSRNDRAVYEFLSSEPVCLAILSKLADALAGAITA